MEKLIFDIEIRTQLDKAIEQLEEVADATEQIADNTEELKKQGKTTGGAIKGLAKGFKGLGLAMKTAGIGLVIEAFNMLKEIIKQNQPIVDLMDKGMTALGIVFNQVADVVVDLGGSLFETFSNPKEAILDLWDFLKQNLINRLIGLQDTLGAFGKILEGVFTFDFDKVKEGMSDVATATIQVATGLDEVQQTNAVEFFVDTAKAIADVATEAVKTADALVEQRKEVELLEAGSQKLMLQYQTQAEVQRQIRDDETKTFAERKSANEELGRILEEQLGKEQEIAQKRLDLAILEASKNKDSLELQKAVIAAETELVDIKERITGQESEQKTNEVALNKELLESQNELRLATLNDKQLEFEQLEQDYKARLDLARKSGEDTVAITKKYNDDVAKANEKYRDIEIAKQKLEQDTKIKTLQTGLDIANTLFEGNEKAQKVFTLAKIGIDTASAISGLMAASQSNPANAVTFGAAGIAQYAAGLLTIASNVMQAKKLLSSKKPKAPTASGGGGGAQAAAISANNAAIESNIDEPLENAEELSEQSVSSFNLGQSLDVFGSNNPIQAYVISQDVQEQSAVSEQISQRATL